MDASGIKSARVAKGAKGAQWIFGEHYISLILGVPNFPNFSIFPFQNQIISLNMMENELFTKFGVTDPSRPPEFIFQSR